ncbi:variant 2, OVARIAN TUMOR DOMAIN-containing deubiquitinating enzyme 4 [Lathyrus oleraceus]|uniref:Variant 2, OVARIAN TUMOR DOMAIN-containing deubiquitinating enzyme 4 n=1 Tax=Pisum sativum TaxID=3888 RepID=A0A9D4WR79_PEA|nr:variant 2, OVARIAN TUMOR DOMAIN-containing deubiquitinating enzyme 4 [Pisum sativum]
MVQVMLKSERSPHSNLPIIRIPGDGRCMFRSVVYGACLRTGDQPPSLTKQKELADELRAKVTYYFYFLFFMKLKKIIFYHDMVHSYFCDLNRSIIYISLVIILQLFYSHRCKHVLFNCVKRRACPLFVICVSIFSLLLVVVMTNCL